MIRDFKDLLKLLNLQNMPFPTYHVLVREIATSQMTNVYDVPVLHIFYALWPEQKQKASVGEKGQSSSHGFLHFLS